MKNIPKVIYLQIGEDCHKSEDYNNLDPGSVSYADERIFDNDIAYIEFSLVKQLIEHSELGNDVAKKINKLMKT